MQVLDRFLHYVSFDTQSDEAYTEVPSTKKQLVLGEVLVKELLSLGIEDAHIDEYGIVYGTLQGNVTTKHTIGFIAHMDTSPDVSGANVKPRIIEDYDGKDIVLDQEGKYITKLSIYPTLAGHVGHTLVVTDGSTLLGADDKAGVAEIMSLVAYFHEHPEVPHGTIKISFTPDEEIGHGTDHFDVAKFGADYAYTMDGGEVAVVEYENFNAASAKIFIKGTNVHPGSAKHKMVNALHLAMEFHQLLPVFDNPAFTEGYEGFHHLNEFSGSVEEASMHYIIRNHDKTKFEQQKSEFQRVIDFLNGRYPGRFALELDDSYANMREHLVDHMEIVYDAMRAVEMAGLTPRNEAIRGGTDGARLTYDGLPCPNLGTGGYIYHSRHEYASVNEMKLAVEVMKHIVALSLKKA